MSWSWPTHAHASAPLPNATRGWFRCCLSILVVLITVSGFGCGPAPAWAASPFAVTGRYVRVTLPSTGTNCLHLGEIAVFDTTYTNRATQSSVVATMSGTWTGDSWKNKTGGQTTVTYYPGNLHDGQAYTFSNTQCESASGNSNMWVMLDLTSSMSQSVDITAITLYNRDTDTNLLTRLNNAVVSIWTATSTPTGTGIGTAAWTSTLTWTQSSAAPGATFTIVVSAALPTTTVNAKSLRVTETAVANDGGRCLAVSDVSIFGGGSNAWGNNLAVGATASQSSEPPGAANAQLSNDVPFTYDYFNGATGSLFSRSGSYDCHGGPNIYLTVPVATAQPIRAYVLLNRQDGGAWYRMQGNLITLLDANNIVVDTSNPVPTPQTPQTTVYLRIILPPLPQAELVALQTLFLAVNGAASSWTGITTRWDNLGNGFVSGTGTSVTLLPFNQLAGAQPCMWTGITCDAAGAHITQIKLNSAGLAGDISAVDWSAFTSLTVLNLASNSLTGTLNINSLATLSLTNSLTVDVSGNTNLGGIRPYFTKFASFITTGTAIATTNPTAPQQLQHLYDIYTNAGGASWTGISTGWGLKNTGFWSTSPLPNPCSPAWTGITCDATGTNTQIQVLDLSNRGLSGANMPIIIGTSTASSALPYLQTLRLSSNPSLTAGVPNLATLPTLTTLDLTSCAALTGVLPYFWRPTLNVVNTWTPTITYLQSGTTALPSGSTTLTRPAPAIVEEVRTLVNLYNNLQGNSWAWTVSTTARWDNTANGMWVAGSAVNPCSPLWYGVQCTSSHISALSLPSFNLAGTLPAPDALTSLTTLVLNGNSGLNGPLPSISPLRALTTINVGGTGITGPLPAFFRAPLTTRVWPTGLNTSTPTPEVTQLYNLFSSTAGGSWTGMTTLWDNDSNGLFTLGNMIQPCGSTVWTGVTCQGSTPTAVNLAGKGLNGNLPTLTSSSITSYVLSNNAALKGSLPPLTPLRNLVLLDVSGTGVTGLAPYLTRPTTTLVYPSTVTKPSTLSVARLAQLVHLYSIYTNTTGDNWTNTGSGPKWDNPNTGLWTTSPDYCVNWANVTCDGTATNLTGLSLSGVGLAGSIAVWDPVVCAGLSTVLLANNPGLLSVGNLLPQLVSFPTLRSLDVSNCAQLSGTYPYFIKPQLTLNTQNSQHLSPYTPANLAQLQALVDLFLNTHGSAWTIPSGVTWDNLNNGTYTLVPNPCTPRWAGVSCDGSGNLVGLNVSSFGLGGSLSPSFNSLSALVTVSLANNPSLVGSGPSLAGSVQTLDMSNCGLTSLPSASTGNSLTTLNARNNQLGSQALQALSPLTQLRTLDVSGNSQVTGILNTTSNTQLQMVSAAGCALTGLSVSTNTQLVSLNVSHNSIAGAFPVLPSAPLTTVDLSYNTLVGAIPLQLPASPPLTSGDWSNNPGLFVQLSQAEANTLVQLYQRQGGAAWKQSAQAGWAPGVSNYLSGTAVDMCTWAGVGCSAPVSWVSGSSSTTSPYVRHISSLSLSDAGLTGPLNVSFTALTSLTVLRLDNNRLTGVAPLPSSAVNISCNAFNTDNTGAIDRTTQVCYDRLTNCAQCTEQACPPLSVVGSVVLAPSSAGSQYSYSGDACSYSCSDVGQVPTTPTQYSCQPNGAWDNTNIPTCQVPPTPSPTPSPTSNPTSPPTPSSSSSTAGAGSSSSTSSPSSSGSSTSTSSTSPTSASSSTAGAGSSSPTPSTTPSSSDSGSGSGSSTGSGSTSSSASSTTSPSSSSSTATPSSSASGSSGPSTSSSSTAGADSSSGSGTGTGTSSPAASTASGSSDSGAGSSSGSDSSSPSTPDSTTGTGTDSSSATPGWDSSSPAQDSSTGSTSGSGSGSGTPSDSSTGSDTSSPSGPGSDTGNGTGTGEPSDVPTPTPTTPAPTPTPTPTPTDVPSSSSSSSSSGSGSGVDGGTGGASGVGTDTTSSSSSVLLSTTTLSLVIAGSILLGLLLVALAMYCYNRRQVKEQRAQVMRMYMQDDIHRIGTAGTGTGAGTAARHPSFEAMEMQMQPNPAFNAYQQQHHLHDTI